MINKIHISQQILDELNKLFREFGQTDYTFDQYELIFSKYGWFIPYEIKTTDVMIIVNQFENNEIDKANSFLINHFKNELKNKEKELINQHPGRKIILSEGFKAHKKKMFNASTLLFISQVDGITENKFYMEKTLKNLKVPTKNIL